MNIIKIKISNFRSYKEEAVLSFEAVMNDYLESNVANVAMKDGSDVRLLKSIAIYGANASGKSNVLWGLRALQFFVMNSRNFPVGKKIQYEPYKFDTTSAQSPIKFSIELIENGEVYVYEIAYNAEIFISEMLTKGIGNDCYTLFEKIWDGKHAKVTVGNDWKGPDVGNVDWLPNHLLLSESSTWPQNELQLVYSAIASMDIEVIDGIVDMRANGTDVANNLLLSQQSRSTERLSRLMKVADVGIEGLKMIRHGDEDFKLPDSIPENEKKRIIENNRWEFRFIHKMKNGNLRDMPMIDESAGTQNLFSLGARVLHVLEQGGILAYDEFHLAVHPQLFKLLVELFHDKKHNRHNAQLLITTHDTTIAHDGMMRADQIWLTEKNEWGESELFSAQDFEDVDITVPFESWYRSGRFGALPSFGNVDYIFDGKE